MNKFNKLYNLILETIIGQNKASRSQMLANVKNHQQIQKYLNTLDNKLADFLAKFFKSGQLKNINDPKIKKVKVILANNPSIDIQQRTSLNDFLAANKQVTKFNDLKMKYSDLDKISELTKKEEYSNGVVIYQVEDSPKGMRAVRNIIDVQWGKDSNPWCLAARGGKNKDLKLAQRRWKFYSNGPKLIAFQNGKLLAFSANGGDHVWSKTTLWWDREDKQHQKLPLLDGTFMKTPQYYQEDIFEKYPQLKLNEETQRYDYPDLLYVNDAYIKDGTFSIPFGKIEGEFNCSNCHRLQNLKNAPTEVGEFTCGSCNELTSLVGMPQKVQRGIFIASNNNLENLEGMPKICYGTLQAYACKNLKSLKGAPEIVKGNCYFSGDEQLTSLQGCPKEVGKVLNLAGCTGLKNLKGISQKIGKGLQLYRCENLQSLKGLNQEGLKICIVDCKNLKLTQEDKKKYKFVDDV